MRPPGDARPRLPLDVDALVASGEAHLAMGDPGGAQEPLLAALPAARAAGVRATEARLLARLGAAFRGSDPDRALEFLDEAAILAHAVGAPLLEAEIARTMAEVYLDRDDPAVATVFLVRGRGFAVAAGDEARELAFLADLVLLGRRVRKELDRAFELAERLGDAATAARLKVAAG